MKEEKFNKMIDKFYAEKLKVLLQPTTVKFYWNVLRAGYPIKTTNKLNL